MKRLAILFVAAAMLIGCGSQSINYRFHEANVMKSDLNVYGAFKAEPAGIVSWNDNNHCNKSAFLLYARTEKQMDKVVDVVMKETCTTIPGTIDMNCKCEYSGYGLIYNQLDVNEAAAWGAIPNKGGQAFAETPASANIQSPMNGPAYESMAP